MIIPREENSGFKGLGEARKEKNLDKVVIH